MKKIISILIFSALLLVGCETGAESSEITYKDLCEFDGAILVELIYKGHNNVLIGCIQNGVAREERVHPILYEYIEKNINLGEIINCDNITIENRHLIPTIE